VINGQKKWIGNATVADVVVVWATQSIGEVWQAELRDAIRANSPILEYVVTAEIVAQPPRLRSIDSQARRLLHSYADRNSRAPRLSRFR
jgi:hypothetical protein